jgi:molecular chaperone HscB
MTDYFSLYDIPRSFHPDGASVKKKYYELSRIHHPDRAPQGNTEAMANALRMSALNNEAYKTLTHADTLMAYILKLHGLLEDEEKYSLPPAFLMEMMELNEAVDSAGESVDSLQLAISNWQDNMTTLTGMVTPLLERYDAGDTTDALLLQIKDHYFRKKYLLRIQDRLAKFATP